MLANIYSSSVPVNGCANQATINLILRFQRDMAARGNRVRVDCAQPSGGTVFVWSSISNSIYTIVLMNQELKRRNPAALNMIPRVVRLSSRPSPHPFSSDSVVPATAGF